MVETRCCATVEEGEAIGVSSPLLMWNAATVEVRLMGANSDLWT